MRYLASAVFGFLLVFVLLWALATLTNPLASGGSDSPRTRIIPLPPLIPHQTPRKQPARPQSIPRPDSLIAILDTARQDCEEIEDACAAQCCALGEPVECREACEAAASRARLTRDSSGH